MLCLLYTSCDLVVSATASPNFTLREELFENLELEKSIVLIDLAVPRDIEPEVGKFEGITLFDMVASAWKKLRLSFRKILRRQG